jgi:hypothetical protein
MRRRSRFRSSEPSGSDLALGHLARGFRGARPVLVLRDVRQADDAHESPCIVDADDSRLVIGNHQLLREADVVLRGTGDDLP